MPFPVTIPPVGNTDASELTKERNDGSWKVGHHGQAMDVGNHRHAIQPMTRYFKKPMVGHGNVTSRLDWHL